MKNLKDFIELTQKVEFATLDEFVNYLKNDIFNEILDEFDLKNIPKPYKELKIYDDFIFKKVMINKDVCKEVLETLLKIEISEINYIEEQKEFQNRRNSKSIKVDIVLKDGKTIFNVELQNVNYGNLHKRAPHYFHVLANYFSESGEDYMDLSNIFVIFICNFDPFEDNLHRYDFVYTCKQDKNLTLGDGSEIVFFNTKASQKEEDDNARKLLDYFRGKYDENDSTNLINKIQGRVAETLRNQNWEDEYMQYNCDLQDLKRDSMQIGEKIGILKGEQIGIQKGEQIGIQKEQIKLVREMYGKIDINLLTEYTGFSLETIENLIKDNDVN